MANASVASVIFGRTALALAGALLVSACSVVGGGSPGPDTAFPYPDGCGQFGLSARRCDFIVRHVERSLQVDASRVQSVQLLGDPGCGGQGPCIRTAPFVVRVRLITHVGPQEQTVLCMIGDQYSLICNERPVVEVATTTLGGFRDMPDGAAPLPTIDPGAAAASKPLRLKQLSVVIDHVGDYDVLVGSAVLPNGILTDASVESIRVDPSGLALDGMVFLAVVPEPGAPPFDNYYVRGWHSGTEAVTVRLRFSVSEPPATGTLTLDGIVVR